MRGGVSLTRISRKKPGGKTYTYWVLRWRTGDGTCRSKSLGRVDRMSRRKAERLRVLKEAEFHLHPARRNAPKPATLAEFLDTCFRVREPELAAGTISLHRQTGKYLIGFFGKDRRIDTILRPDGRAFKAALAAGELAHVDQRKRSVSDATVQLHVRNARTVFQMAVDDDIIPFNPFGRLAGSAPPPKARQEVTDEEFSRLMTVASPAWRLLLGLARFAALRRGEALSLTWAGIDWENRRLSVIAHEE